MDYKRLIVNTMDALNAPKSCLGYDYVVYGLLLMLDNQDCITYITKSLYIDIADHYHTTWKCVEKNIRTVVGMIWSLSDSPLIRIIFKHADCSNRPTNKVFFRYMYEYISLIACDMDHPEHQICFICPVSNQYCESLEFFYHKLSQAHPRIPSSSKTKLHPD